MNADTENRAWYASVPKHWVRYLCCLSMRRKLPLAVPYGCQATEKAFSFAVQTAWYAK